MSEKQCDFCDRLKLSNNLFQFWKQRPEHHPKQKQVISVAFVERSWEAGDPNKRSSRVVDYRYRGCGYKLNYCPECGRKIKKKEINQK